MKRILMILTIVLAGSVASFAQPDRCETTGGVKWVVTDASCAGNTITAPMIKVKFSHQQPYAVIVDFYITLSDGTLMRSKNSETIPAYNNGNGGSIETWIKLSKTGPKEVYKYNVVIVGNPKKCF